MIRKQDGGFQGLGRGALVFNEFVLQGPWTVVGGDGCVTM